MVVAEKLISEEMLYPPPEKDISNEMPVILIPSPDIAKAFFENEYKGKEDFSQYEVTEVFEHHQAVPWKFVETFISENTEYVDSAHAEGLHGPQHEARVLGNFIVLAQAEGLSELEILIGCFSAWGHDLARANDINDPGHGSRSSLHILKNLKSKVAEKLNYLKENSLITIDVTEDSINEILGGIMDICTWHEVPYKNVPKSIKQGKYERLFRVFTDADKVDGDRDNNVLPGTENNPVPSREWWTKPRYLTTYSGRKLFFWGTPRYLTLSSENDRLNKGLSVKEIMKAKITELDIAYDDDVISNPIAQPILYEELT